MIPKFRAWYKENKEMKLVNEIIGLYAFDNDYPIVRCLGDVELLNNEYELMQSTGLHDKYGVEIFEGDIIRCSRGCPHRVIWVKEYGGSFIGGMPAWYLSGLNEGYSWTGAEEIIGNSWENPELLEDVE